MIDTTDSANLDVKSNSNDEILNGHNHETYENKTKSPETVFREAFNVVKEAARNLVSVSIHCILI